MPHKVFRGDRLKQLRKAAGLTQADLMMALSISRDQAVRYERNLSIPSVHTLSVLAHLLNSSTDYLLGLADTPLKPFHTKDLEFLKT